MKTRLVKETVTIVSVLFILISCGNRTGNTNSDKYDYSFPHETHFTKEYLIQNFWKCNYRQAGDSLAYWIILPNNIRPFNLEPVAISGTGLTTIGQYKTIDDGAYIEIEMAFENVAEYIQPVNWVTEKLRLAEHDIIDSIEIQAESGEKFMDVLTYRTMSGEAIVSRVVVFRRGLNYLLLCVMCSGEDYEELAETIAHITMNWNML